MSDKDKRSVEPKRVVRTTAGLVDALFDTVDKLNAKEIDAEHARAISHTARSIVGVARLELEYRQFVEGGGPQLTSLMIEKTPPSPPTITPPAKP